MLNSYLEKHAYRPPFFFEVPTLDLELIVVIPAYNESSLIQSVESISFCDRPIQGVEVIVVFNASEKDDTRIIQLNEKTAIELEDWYSSITDPWFNLLIIQENSLPEKQSGVGLSRKIGMDEAVRRFLLAKNPQGIICCYDADSLCQQNYLIEVEKHFKNNALTEACSIHFEHPITGVKYSEEIYLGITYYELFLRYYKNGINYANFPFSYHTIGSSMSVRAIAYCKEGGMNKRKAGEDFYFLQKFISIDKLSELKTTTIIPSPRPSNRVPFGTGRAIKEMLIGNRDITLGFSFEIFQEMKNCFLNVSDWYQNKPNPSKNFIDFLGGQTNFDQKIIEIRSQTADKDRFVKRLFQWFNALKALKYAHYLRDNVFPSKPLVEETIKLLNTLNKSVDSKSPVTLLSKLRDLDNYLPNL